MSLSESMEDYLEAILEIHRRKQVVRVRDVAQEIDGRRLSLPDRERPFIIDPFDAPVPGDHSEWIGVTRFQLALQAFFMVFHDHVPVVGMKERREGLRGKFLL